ncbi:putative DNA-binding protein 2 [Bacillus phage BSP36]|nr:putative DNA-binding protein 2 [Bacillus phage BSP36]
MALNRKEIARRIALEGGYNIGDIEHVLEVYEDVIEAALKNGEEVKQGKLYKIIFQELPEKKAYDGLNKKYFVRKAKKVPKFKPLTRITNIELPVAEEE